MPPKEEEKQETVAIILADAFEAAPHFGPLTQADDDDEDEIDSVQKASTSGATPFCLLRLAGTPLLAYTLDAVLNARIDKAYIYARHAAADPIRAFLARAFPFSPQTDIILRTTAASSEGDVMREVDALQLKSSFLLIRAGYVGNLDLASALSHFSAKVKKNPNLCMECIVARNSSTWQQTTHVLASSSSRLIHYERRPRNQRKRCRIPNEVFEDGAVDLAQLTVRTDLESVGIDICSPEVPPLFTENFDYQSTRPHFINGILTSDLLGKTISCLEIDGACSGPKIRSPDWATLVETARAFGVATNAVLTRLCYPITPDEHLPGGQRNRYKAQHNNVYVDSNVEIARSAVLKTASIGANSVLKSGVYIKASSMGSDCVIGDRCQLVNVHLGDKVTIENDVVMRDCLVGSRARVCSGSKLIGGSLVGDDCIVGSGSRLERAVVGSVQGECLFPASCAELGEGSRGIIWQPGEDDEDEETSTLERSAKELALLGANLNFLKLQTSSSSLSSLSRGSSSASLAEEVADVASVPLTNGALPPSSNSAITYETTLFLERAFQENHTVDNLVIELKTMRMASNSSLSDIRDIFTHYLCSKTNLDGAANIRAKYDAVCQQVQRWGAVLTTLAPLSDNDEIDVLLSLQMWAARQEEAKSKSFVLWLRAFYEEDIVSEDSIFGWWQDPRSRPAEDEAAKGVRQSAMIFVQQLSEADSDSEDE